MKSQKYQRGKKCDGREREGGGGRWNALVMVAVMEVVVDEKI